MLTVISGLVWNACLVPHTEEDCWALQDPDKDSRSTVAAPAHIQASHFCTGVLFFFSFVSHQL